MFSTIKFLAKKAAPTVILLAVAAALLLCGLPLASGLTTFMAVIVLCAS